MMVLATMVLLAVSSGSQLMDEVHQIPAGDWKFVEVQLRQQPARISARYEVLSGSAKVRAALMLREDLDRMNGDLPGSIVQTEEGRSGSFADPVRRRGDFVVVLDNEDEKQAATVRLRVALDFSQGTGPEVKQLTAQRRLAVVAISFATFFGIVGFSARQLLRSMRG
jgi:hypothetical protein